MRDNGDIQVWWCPRNSVQSIWHSVVQSCMNDTDFFHRTLRARDSSVGRAEDCRCLSAIFRSLVRLRFAGLLFSFAHLHDSFYRTIHAHLSFVFEKEHLFLQAMTFCSCVIDTSTMVAVAWRVKSPSSFTVLFEAKHRPDATMLTENALASGAWRMRTFFYWEQIYHSPGQRKQQMHLIASRNIEAVIWSHMWFYSGKKISRTRWRHVPDNVFLTMKHVKMIRYTLNSLSRAMVAVHQLPSEMN